mgnify:CR=1 FL=1
MRDTTQPAVTPNPPNERRECSETDSGSILSGTQPPTSAGGEVQSKGARSVRRPSSMVWLVLLLTLPAVLPLLAPGYFYKAHDARHSVFYLIEFDQAFRAGAWWPVWGPDHAIGFGYPLWLIYAPLAYFIGEAFHLLGLGFTAAIKATWAVGFLLGGLGMYRLARRWWGEAAGLIASVAFTYAPYHLVQIYVRAALAEFMALAVVPWTLLALVNAWERPGPRRAALAALGVAALLISHTVSVLSFVPLLAGFMLVLLVRSLLALRGQPDRAVLAGLQRPLGWTLAGGILGGLLASIFLLPLALERPYINEAQWVGASYSYEQHFVYPLQFLDPGWGFGYSVPGPGDGMSFQLGLVVLATAGVGVVAALSSGRRGQLARRGEGVFLVLATAVALFVMTPAAAFIWDNLSIIKMVQFPWRLLAVTVFTLALLAGAGVHWLERRQTNPARRISPYVYGLAALLIVASLPYTVPQLVPIRPQDEQPVAVIEFELDYPDMRGMTSWSERMALDEDSPLIAQYLAGEPLRRAAVIGGEAEIISQEAGPLSASAQVRAAGSARLRFYTYYFPGWQAWVDGQPVPIAPDPPNGLIGVDVPAGEHTVEVRFGPTPVRRTAALISLAALAGVVMLLLLPLRDLPKPGDDGTL